MISPHENKFLVNYPQHNYNDYNTHHRLGIQSQLNMYKWSIQPASRRRCSSWICRLAICVISVLYYIHSSM
jgi:hypothetical protein